MKRLDSKLDGPILVQPVVHGDHRGFFHETYRRNVYEKLGITDEFVQDNHSRSGKGIVRGMHFQIGAGMAKLVRCSRGAILDVIVDLRAASPTYLRHQGFELSAANRHQLYVPPGFAHGFQTLVDDVEVSYLVSAAYAPAAEGGLRHDDPALGIAWPMPATVISAKDAAWPLLDPNDPAAL